MTILELQEKRNKVWEGAKAFLESNRNESGILSAEDDTAYSKMERDMENLGHEITRLERAEAFERKMEQTTSQPLLATPESIKATDKRPHAKAEYAEAMMTAFRTSFKNVSDTLHTGVDSEGGYLVPEEWDSRLFQVLNGENIMRQLGTTIKTEGTHKINIANSTPVGAWIDEGEAIKFDAPDIGQKLLDAHKLSVGVKVTDELLFDEGYDLESFIQKSFGETLANMEEEAFLNGTGTTGTSKRPTGIFHTTEGGEFSSTVTNINGDAVIDLVYSLKRQYRKKSSFIMNDEMVKLIRKLKDSNGQYLWQPSVVGSEPDTLLGYKLYTSQFAPVGYVAFGDYSYYNIGDRGNRSFKKLVELFAGNGKVGFVAQERVDGKLILPETVQILTVSSSVSST